MSQLTEEISFRDIKRRVEQSRMDARSLPHDDPAYNPACRRHLEVLNGAITQLQLLEKSTEVNLSIEIAGYRSDRVQERDRLKTKLS
jgi:hypothetical protein